MNSNIWKIATINVKGINNTKKFDDIMEWIIQNDFDATILTETKLRLILAIFNSIKYQKNYTSHWTIDPEHTKGSGVAIITKKNTIGNHIYRHQLSKRRCITLYCKFKRKKTITITGIYGPAANNSEARITIQTIINHIHTLPENNLNTHHIFLRDYNGDSSRFTKTETLIFKERRAITNLFCQAKLSLILDSNERIRDLEKLFLDIIWKPYSLPSETQRTLEHIKTKWQEKKRKLYILKERETHKHIIKAVKTRNDNFKENKGRMFRSSLEKKFNYIDTSNIIDDGKYIDNPNEIKETISLRARAWTRPRRFHDPERFWRTEYEPKQYVPTDAFEKVMDTISSDELQAALKEAPINKAAGPSGLSYKCWKHASTSVHEALLEVFERSMFCKRMPTAWKKTNTILIPKLKNWNKNIDITRPIVLIEIVRKLFTKIFTNRLKVVCR